MPVCRKRCGASGPEAGWSPPASTRVRPPRSTSGRSSTTTGSPWSPTALTDRWDSARLHAAVMDLLASGRLDPMPLVTHVVPVEDAAEAYRLLDETPEQALQVVLDFRDDAARRGVSRVGDDG